MMGKFAYHFLIIQIHYGDNDPHIEKEYLTDSLFSNRILRMLLFRIMKN